MTPARILFNAVLLKSEALGRLREGAEGRRSVLEIEDLGVVVVGAVHRLEARVEVEHGLLGLAPVVIYELSAYPEPLLAVERADLGLRIRRELLGNVLYLAGLDLELTLEEHRGAERAHSRLVAVHRREVVGTDLLQKLINLFDSFHGRIPPLSV
jgi:hypothetical protein